MSLNTSLHAAGAAADMKAAALGRMAVAGAAAGVAIAMAAKAVEEFAQKQTAVVSLDAALANQGQLVDSVREKYQALADTLEQTTNIDDGHWLNALATLSKFDASPDKIEEYADAVKNLAGFMGDGVESAAFVFGKAMKGSFQMLSRYGIEVDESATQTEKLNRVMEQLAQRGGGQLEARTHTITGGFAGFKIAVGNVWEGLGNLISQTHVLDVAMTVLNGTINGLAEMFPTLVEKVGGLENKFKELGVTSAEAMVKAQKEIKDAVDATNTALDKQLKDIQRIRAVNDSMGDEQAATKLAEVDAREARNEISPIDANLERTKIKQDLQRRKLAEKQFAAQKTADAAQEARTGASGQTSAADAAADTAQDAVEKFAAAQGLDPGKAKFDFAQANRDAAAAQKKIAANTIGSTLGIPNGTDFPENKAARAEGQQDLERAEAKLEAIKKLNELTAAAAAARAAAAAAQEKETKVFESTAPALQAAADELAVLAEQYKRFTAEVDKDKATDMKARFAVFAKYVKEEYDVDIHQPTPEEITAEKARQDKAKNPPRAPFRALTPNELTAEAQSAADKVKARENLNNARDRDDNEMRRRDLRERPETEPSGWPDTSALNDVKDSTGNLTANIESFAEGTMALHEATVSKLQKLAGKLDNLESRVLSHY